MTADGKLSRHLNWCLSADRFFFFTFSTVPLDSSLPHTCSLCFIQRRFVSVMAAGWSPCGHWRIYCLFLWCHKNTHITYSHSSHITGCASLAEVCVTVYQRLDHIWLTAERIDLWLYLAKVNISTRHVITLKKGFCPRPRRTAIFPVL